MNANWKGQVVGTFHGGWWAFALVISHVEGKEIYEVAGRENGMDLGGIGEVCDGLMKDWMLGV